MEIIEKNIDEIIPYANNPRNNDEAVDKVAASIKEYGFKVPIVIDKENVIVTGHTRLKAAKKLKLDKVPCIMADDLTDAQIKAFRLADNKVSEFSTWDFEKLELELEDLGEIDMSEFGFENLEEEPGENNDTSRDDKSDEVQSMFQIIIECADENEQEKVFEELKSEGYQCRVLTL